MSYRNSGSNNDVGTHDNETTRDKWRGGGTIRWESSEHGEQRYFVGKVHPSGENKCRACVTTPDGFHSTQCSRKGRLEYRGYLFCKQHYPPNVFAKAKARHQAWEDKWDARRRQAAHNQAMRDWEEQCMKALEAIAAGGMNDPAGFAAMVLGNKPEKP